MVNWRNFLLWMWMELWQVFFDRCEISGFMRLRCGLIYLRMFSIWCRLLVTLAIFSKEFLDSNFRSFDKIEIEDAASLQPPFSRSKLFSCFIMWSCNEMYCNGFYIHPEQGRYNRFYAGKAAISIEYGFLKKWFQKSAPLSVDHFQSS